MRPNRAVLFRRPRLQHKYSQPTVRLCSLHQTDGHAVMHARAHTQPQPQARIHAFAKMHSILKVTLMSFSGWAFLPLLFKLRCRRSSCRLLYSTLTGVRFGIAFDGLPGRASLYQGLFLFFFSERSRSRRRRICINNLYWDALCVLAAQAVRSGPDSVVRNAL